MSNGLEDDGPAGAEAACSLSPAQHLRPRCEKPGERDRSRRLAFAPWQKLHLDATAQTVAAPWCIHEVDRDSPQRHELIPTLAEGIVAAALLAAARTHRVAAAPRQNRNIDPAPGMTRTQVRRLVDESRVLFNEIQDSLQLHRCGGCGCCKRHPRTMHPCVGLPTWCTHRLQPNAPHLLVAAASVLRTARVQAARRAPAQRGDAPVLGRARRHALGATRNHGLLAHRFLGGTFF